MLGNIGAIYINKLMLRIAIMLIIMSALAACERGPAADCDIDHGRCVKEAGGLVIVFDAEPKPVRAMRELTFLAVVTKDGRPIQNAAVSIDLTMPGMVMGQNVVKLFHTGNGSYKGKGVIVRCPSGKKLWKASVSVQRSGNTAAADFLFEAP